MRFFINFLALAILVADGAYTMPTPEVANPAVASAIHAAERVTQNWGKNNHLEKRFWGDLLKAAGSIASGVLQTILKRDVIPATPELAKRRLSFLEPDHYPVRRTLSFLNHYKEGDKIYAKRENGVDIEGKKIPSAKVQMLQGVLNTAASGVKDSAEQNQEISDTSDLLSGANNGDQTPSDQQYFDALADQKELATNVAAQKEIDLNKKLHPNGVVRRRRSTDPSSPEGRAAQDDTAQVQQAVKAAASKYVAETNAGHTLSQTEKTLQESKTAALIVSTMAEQVKTAATASDQPIGEEENEKYGDETETETSSTTSPSSTGTALNALKSVS